MNPSVIPRSGPATWLRQWAVVLLKPRGKLAFLRTLPPNARVLDVGCGNNSPREFKMLRPDLIYTGVDVGDYNQQDPLRYADAYVVVPPSEFARAIAERAGQMDAVVSAHNLEHCDDPASVLDAMVTALRPGGRLFLAFPCEASVRFPKRRGSLNFFDDGSHRQVPEWDRVLGTLRERGVSVIYAAPRYRPKVLAIAGLVLEPLAWLLGRNMPAGSTWALYGFESLLWGRRDAAAASEASVPRPT